MAKEPAKCSQCGSRLQSDGTDGGMLCPNCRTVLAPSDEAGRSSSTHPLIGQTLGDFEIVDLLGRGGMGAVYKAREPSLDRFVALKVLPAGLTSDSRFVIRFEREARAAAAVHHPNIVGIHAVGQARGYRYIAMEFIDGETLGDVLKREGRLPQGRALNIMKRVLAALAAAHEAGIVHRDIKPSNIMFDSRGDVRVTDFGLAKRTAGDVSATQVGESLGTPLYMAPEAASGTPADARSDLYSLGATFFALLAGRPPFEGKTPGELIIKHATEMPPPLEELAPDVDPRLCQIIDRLLHKDPAERYPSAQALLDELEALGDLTTPADAARAQGEAMLVDAPTLTLSDGRRLEREAAAKRLLPRGGIDRKRAAIIGAVAVAAAVTLAIVIVALIERRQPQARRQPPTDAPSDTEGVGKGDPGERQAEAIFRRAKQAAERSDWAAVKTELDRLKDQYADTRYYADHLTAIAELRAKAGKPRRTPGVVEPPPTDWVSLFDGKTLDGWRVLRKGEFSRGGAVRVEDGRILLGAGLRTGIVWTGQTPPREDYEVTYEAMRLAKDRSFGDITFPVGDSYCTFVLGEFGTNVVALGWVDGKSPRDNITTKTLPLKNGHWYRVTLRVTKARVTVSVGADRVVDLPRAGHRFTLWPAFEPTKPLGISAFRTSAAVRDLRLRRLEPEERPLEAAGDWVSLFDGKTLEGWRIVEEGPFRRHGPVGVEAGNIALGQGPEATGIAWAGEFPRVDYEASLEVRHEAGNDTLCNIVFPVGQADVIFSVGGWKLTVTGLTSVDGRAATGNATGGRMRVVPRRWYRVRLRVTEPRVEAWIDDKKVVDLATAGRTFTIGVQHTPLRPFGLCNWRGSTLARNIRMRRLKPQEPPPEPAGEWVSLFDGKTLGGWRVAEEGHFANHGDVRADRGRIVLEAGERCTGIATTRDVPTTDYELSVEAMRVAGGLDFCNIIFPLGASHCELMVGGSRGGRLVGLEEVDGRRAGGNPTARRMDFARGRWYRVRLRVTQPSIEVWIDDEKLIDIERAGHVFAKTVPYTTLQPLGIFTWTTTAALRNIRLRRLKPEGRVEAAGPECRLLATLRGHTRAVVSVAFSPNGTRVATGSQDATVKLWDAADWQCLHTLQGHEGFVESIAFSSDGKRLITSSMDHTVRIWDAATGECLRVLEGHTDAVHGAFFLADGQRAVSAGSDGALRIWDTTTGKCLKTFTHPDGANHVQHMALSADGKRLATGGKDGVLKLWDTETGACLRKIRAGSRELWCIAFSTDGERVATAGNDRSVKVWNTATGQLVKRLDTPRLNRGLAYSPDGKWLAAGDWNGSLQFWDGVTYDHVKAIRAHGHTAFKIVFSADGKRLASASFDGTAKIWALEPGRVVQREVGKAKPPKLPERPGVWAPLFDGETLGGWRVMEGGAFRRHGEVRVEQGRIVLGQASRTAIAWTGDFPTVDYELSLEARRKAGAVTFCGVFLPVGSSRCVFSVGGWGGTVVGLGIVDGRNSKENDTTRRMNFQPMRWYRVRVRVTEAKVEAWIDDEQVVDFSRAGRRLTPHEQQAEVPTLGLCSWLTTAGLRGIKMQLLESQPEEPPAGGKQLKTATVAVSARADWFDTGLYLAKGNGYEMSAAGRWGPRQDWTRGPEGGGGPPAREQHALPGGPNSALIARVGTQGRPFAVGSQAAFTAPRLGTLHLRMNDKSTFDNWGSLRVAVKGSVVASPSAPLLGRFTKVLRKVQVDARSDWADSGVELRRGDVVLITASGRWGAGPGQENLGPDGCDDKAWRLHRRGALTGRIGLHGEQVTIGALHLLQAREPGKLFLAMHDELREDNRGSVTVTVLTSPALDERRKKPAARAELDCRLLATLTGHQGWIVAVTFSPDGARVASGGRDRTAKLWDATTGRCLHTLRGHADTVEACAFSPDGKQIATASKDRTIRLWDVATGRHLKVLTGHRNEIKSIAFFPDKEWLVSGGNDQTIRIWDLPTGRCVRTLTGHRGGACVAVSPGGKRIVSSGFDGWIQVWDMATWQRDRRFFAQSRQCWSVAWTPDGKRLVSVGDDHVVKVWSAATGECLKTLDAPLGNRCVAVSPDGKWIACSGTRSAFQLWDAATYECVRTVEAHTGEVKSLAFSRDGKRLASASFDGTIKIWSLEPRGAADRQPAER